MNNPLLNELILSNLFSFIPIEELVTCRLVCKKWNYSAIPYVRKLTKIEFFGYTLKNLNTFLSAVSQTSDFPFGRFGFQIWDSESFRSRFPSLPEESEHFFSACGPRIKYLRVGFNDFLETVTVPEFRKWFLSSVPNIQSLELSGLSIRIVSAESIFDENGAEKIDIFPNLTQLLISDTFGEVSENPGGHERYNPRVLLDLLHMCPYVQNLTVNTGELRSSLIPSMMSALESQYSMPNLNSYLNKLCLQCILSEENLRAIIGCHLTLKHLELHYLETDVQKYTLEKLLIRQRSSLKILVLGEHFLPTHGQPALQYEPLRLEFPCMEELRRLTVNRPYPSRKLAFMPKVFSDSLPNLTTLDLGNILVNLEDFFPNDLGENSSLRKLRLPSGFASVGLMENIMKNFSNLWSLTLDCPSDEIMKLIWEVGSNLKELELTNVGFLEADSNFTGLPSKICEWIQEENAYFRVNENFFEVVGRQKSVIQLTRLQRLILEFQTNPESMYYISDVSGYLAIPQLKNLTSLTIRNSQISTECYRWIAENLELVHLDISG